MVISQDVAGKTGCDEKLTHIQLRQFDIVWRYRSNRSSRLPQSRPNPRTPEHGEARTWDDQRTHRPSRNDEGLISRGRRVIALRPSAFRKQMFHGGSPHYGTLKRSFALHKKGLPGAPSSDLSHYETLSALYCRVVLRADDAGSSGRGSACDRRTLQCG